MQKERVLAKPEYRLPASEVLPGVAAAGPALPGLRSRTTRPFPTPAKITQRRRRFPSAFCCSIDLQ